MPGHSSWRLKVIFQRQPGHSASDITRARAARIVKGTKREVAMWPGMLAGVGRLDLRMGVHAPVFTTWLHFTLKAFSRLMDDFSLTNSDCELSAREIPGTSRASRPLRLSIFFPRATSVFHRAHKLSSSIKTLLPARALSRPPSTPS